MLLEISLSLYFLLSGMPPWWSTDHSSGNSIAVVITHPDMDCGIQTDHEHNYQFSVKRFCVLNVRSMVIGQSFEIISDNFQIEESYNYRNSAQKCMNSFLNV
jgi:hypothetical protein